MVVSTIMVYKHQKRDRLYTISTRRYISMFTSQNLIHTDHYSHETSYLCSVLGWVSTGIGVQEDSKGLQCVSVDGCAPQNAEGHSHVHASKWLSPHQLRRNFTCLQRLFQHV